MATQRLALLFIALYVLALSTGIVLYLSQGTKFARLTGEREPARETLARMLSSALRI